MAKLFGIVLVLLSHAASAYKATTIDTATTIDAAGNFNGVSKEASAYIKQLEEQVAELQEAKANAYIKQLEENLVTLKAEMREEKADEGTKVTEVHHQSSPRPETLPFNTNLSVAAINKGHCLIQNPLCALGIKKQKDLPAGKTETDCRAEVIAALAETKKRTFKDDDEKKGLRPTIVRWNSSPSAGTNPDTSKRQGWTTDEEFVSKEAAEAHGRRAYMCKGCLQQVARACCIFTTPKDYPATNKEGSCA